MLIGQLPPVKGELPVFKCLHGLSYTIERKRKHFLADLLSNETAAGRVAPPVYMRRVKPYHIRKVLPDALQPDQAGFVILMLYAAPCMCELIGSHAGITYKDGLVVSVVAIEHLKGWNLLFPSPAVVFPYGLIGAVMKVVVLQMLKLMAGGAKEPLAALNMLVHTSAYIKKEQHLYIIAAAGPHLNIQIAGNARGLIYGFIEVELLVAASSVDVRSRVRAPVAGSRVDAGDRERELVVSEAGFRQLYGGPVPDPTPILPFTRDTLVEELDATGMGRVVQAGILRIAHRQTAKLLGDDPDPVLARLSEAIIREAPLRFLTTMSGGAGPLRAFDGLAGLLSRLRLPRRRSR